MKNIYLIFFLFISYFTFSQNSDVTETKGKVLSKASFTIGAGSIFHNPSNQLIGSPYFFKNWHNKNYVHLYNQSKETTKVRLNTINLNVKIDKFVTKIDEETDFNFNANYFDYVIINNRRFEYFYDSTSNIKKIYEVIASFKSKKILKRYFIYTHKGKVKAYQSFEPVDKLIIKSDFFIFKNDSLTKFKFKKKNILSLFKNQKELIKNYAKKEKLSFKKEKDLRKIIAYYNSL